MARKPQDLVSLEDAQVWIGANSAQTTLVSALITAVSRTILTSLNRGSILPSVFQENIDGNGIPRIMLRNFPVLSIQQLVIDRLAIPAAPAPSQTAITPGSDGYGYLLSDWDGSPPGGPQMVDVFGYSVCRGRKNISVTYRAGYQITGEGVIIGTGLSATATQPYGSWATDEGVTYQGTGLALQPVARATPAVGQYSVDASGNYTFAAADAGQSVLISYGYIPADLANATAQWVGELLSYQGRIGYHSKSLGGQESVSFIVDPIPKIVGSMISSFRRNIPL